MFKRWMLRGIRFYQRRISANTAPKCRHFPTCSNYALEAIEIHGALKGGLLSIWRILKCNPLVKPQIDFPPEKRGKK